MTDITEQIEQVIQLIYSKLPEIYDSNDIYNLIQFDTEEKLLNKYLCHTQTILKGFTDIMQYQNLDIEYVINTPTGRAIIIKKWSQNIIPHIHSLLFNHIKENIDLQQKPTYQGKFLTPRLLAFQGDEDIIYHTYSGTSHNVGNWDDITIQIVNILREQLGVYFNSSLINYYRDRNDYISYHSDQEVVGLYNEIVVGLSLGGTRRFYFKDKRTKEVIKTVVEDGDLMIMEGDIQQKYLHSVPKQVGVKERISITYRILTV